MFPVSWRYPEESGGRDLRLDFLRGLAMAFVIMFHVGGLSLFHLFAMFGMEVVAGGEVFVLMSGIALGQAQRRRIEHEGWDRSVRHLLLRAGQLYVLFVAVTMSGWFLSRLPFPDPDVLTVWQERPADPAISMFGDSRDVRGALMGVVLLRYGPWQYGIVGLFVLLAALTPLALRLLAAGRWWVLLAISWVLYAVGVTREIRVIEGVFEGGAPLLTWQLVFMHGLVVGHHRARVWSFFYSRRARPVIALSFLIGAGLIFFALNAPWVSDVLWRRLPSWASLAVLSPDEFHRVQDVVFGSRQWPALGRLASVGAAGVVFTTLLTLLWTPTLRAIGWLMIPLGQHSLLVFTLHVYVLFTIAQLGLIGERTIIANTIVQTGAVIVLWLAVRMRTRWRDGSLGDGVRVPTAARAPSAVSDVPDASPRCGAITPH